MSAYKELEKMKRAEEVLQQRVEDAEHHKKQQEMFVDMICHEIRNPLNGITNNMELIKGRNR